jgi:hypothetical protein
MFCLILDSLNWLEKSESCLKYSNLIICRSLNAFWISDRVFSGGNKRTFSGCSDLCTYK